MNIMDLLPIGSIVLLKGAEKRLMIYGVKQHDPKNREVEYDYCGVLYPEGNIGGETTFLFNHEDIGMVLFRGYEDEERKVFIRNLNEYYTAVREGREPIRQD